MEQLPALHKIPEPNSCHNFTETDIKGQNSLSQNIDSQFKTNDISESTFSLENNLVKNVNVSTNNSEKDEVEKVLNTDRRKIVTGDGILPAAFHAEAENDLHEKQEWIDRDIEALRDLVIAEEGLRSRTDKPFLLAYLRARKFDYERALNMIRGYYKSRYDNSELYVNLSPANLQHIWDKKMQTVLPLPDKLGRTVLIFRTSAWNPEESTLDDIFRAQVLLLEHIARVPITQLKGITAIVDCSGLSMSHVYYLTPTHIKRMVSLLQEVFPLRFKALHFINEPSIFDWVFSLFKPFLSDTIKSRLIFHGDNVKGLHDHVPAEILPSEFSGCEPSMENKELVDLMKLEDNYFTEHFSYGYDTMESPTSAQTSPSLLGSVADMGSYIGSYYRRMCIE